MLEAVELGQGFGCGLSDTNLLLALATIPVQCCKQLADGFRNRVWLERVHASDATLVLTGSATPATRLLARPWSAGLLTCPCGCLVIERSSAAARRGTGMALRVLANVDHPAHGLDPGKSGSGIPRAVCQRRHGFQEVVDSICNGVIVSRGSQLD